jgi:hypothetical protein
MTKQVMEAILIKVLLCTYPNWCDVCSKVTIDNAVKVLDVNWTHCDDTRDIPMTVKNSTNSELYQNQVSCCDGNITIHYHVHGKVICNALIKGHSQIQYISFEKKNAMHLIYFLS